MAINLSVEEQARTKIFREAICQTQTSVERSKESVCNQQVLLGNVEGRHYLQGKRSVFQTYESLATVFGPEGVVV